VALMFVQGNEILMVVGADIAPVNALIYKDGRITYTLRRLRVALKLWRTGGYDWLLVSGGASHTRDRETRAAALTMREWLIDQGIPSGKILIESRSLDTFENARFSLEVLEWFRIRDPKITLVTHWQHCARFWVTFRALGTRVRFRPVFYWIGWKGFFVEAGGLYVHITDPLGKGPIPVANRNQRRINQGREPWEVAK
jgi:uncharacterized SAM-binding protein YcdF (DUF218 family)